MGSGAISERQMSSSSQLDDAHAAVQGRLNSRPTEDKGGSWSAASNNRNQWLEIDLVSQNINVTRVATQGRHDSSQWVTKYKLQYSKDGVNFQYYKEPMETAHKVALICSQTSLLQFPLQIPFNHLYLPNTKFPSHQCIFSPLTCSYDALKSILSFVTP